MPHISKRSGKSKRRPSILEGMSLEDVGKEETDEIEVEEIQIEN